LTFIDKLRQLHLCNFVQIKYCMHKSQSYTFSPFQQPIATGFDAFTTSGEIMQGINLAGINAIVTGGYSGIGLETVRQLHQAGATVIVPARNLLTTREIFKDFSDRLEIAYMDLLQPETISRFADRFISSGRPLHLLINNAGVMASPLSRDSRGYESQFSTNHLGHFQLTIEVWEALKRAEGARVISVSSLGHRFSDILYDNPNFYHVEYDKWKAYGQSKTANILFSVQLDELGKNQAIRAYSLHPGRITDTNLKKYLSNEDLQKAGIMDERGRSIVNPELDLKTVEQGAATTLFFATNHCLDNIGGVYGEDCNIAEIADSGTDISTMKKGVLPYAIDITNAGRLWRLSEELTGTVLR
jgi:NAD(P)-dependent dehydrogenase (short-subunit alcohol dehydrogenase family)